MKGVRSVWYGVDGVGEKYVGRGGYVYRLDNGVRLIDGNGNWWWGWEGG